MDLNAFVNYVQHNGILMFGLGLAFSQRLKILHYAVLSILKVPLLRVVALGHPQEVLNSLDAFRAEVAADLADLQKQQAIPPVQPSAPGPHP